MNIPEYESYHEKKTHFDSGFPYNTYLCSIPLDFSQVPLHWHDEIELIYIKKGSGSLSINFKNYHVNSGDIALILPGQLHSISQQDQEIMEYENIIFQPYLLQSGGGDLCYHSYLKPLLEHHFDCPSILKADLPIYSRLCFYLDENDRICMDFPQGYPLAIKGNLFSFFYVLFSTYGSSRYLRKAEKNIDKLKSVIKYVEMNYSEPMTLSDMARICNFSESYFMKFFKNTMDESFIQYLNDYRLTMAARLLLLSEESVLNIASQVGFENLSYFNRCFKKRYAMTPSQYRKNQHQ